MKITPNTPKIRAILAERASLGIMPCTIWGVAKQAGLLKIRNIFYNFLNDSGYVCPLYRKKIIEAFASAFDVPVDELVIEQNEVA